MDENKGSKEKILFGFESIADVQNSSDESSYFNELTVDREDHKLTKQLTDSKKEKFEELQKRRKMLQCRIEKNMLKKHFRKLKKKKKKLTNSEQSDDIKKMPSENLSTGEEGTTKESQCQKISPDQKEKQTVEQKSMKKFHWGFDAKERWEMKGNL